MNWFSINLCNGPMISINVSRVILLWHDVLRTDGAAAAARLHRAIADALVERFLRRIEDEAPLLLAARLAVASGGAAVRLRLFPRRSRRVSLWRLLRRRRRHRKVAVGWDALLARAAAPATKTRRRREISPQSLGAGR